MDDLLKEIQNRLSIVQLIEREIPLKKRGKNYIGLCPFHVEKTPSFTVNEEKGLFYCFGCQEGGNLFQFWMKYKNLPFYEALVELGKHVGIDVRKRQSRNSQKPIKKESFLMDILQSSTRRFQENLFSESGRWVRDYLKKRGVSESSMREFSLGFAKKSWSDLRELLERKGFSKKEQLQSHMVSESREGSLFDSFQNRLMFPIRDEWNHVVAFGSRSLGEENNVPKYLNSQENPYFKKRNLLYGLNSAKESIGKTSSVLLVEGYVDVILCHQNGLLHAVAPLGTSLSEFQIQKLSRYAKKMFLALDGDFAGEKAMNRAIELSLNTDLQTVVLELPAGSDPADYLLQFGKNAWNQLPQREALDYYLKSTWSKYKEKNSAEKRQYLNASYSFLQKIQSEIHREEAFKKLAQLLRVSVNAIKKEYQQLQKKYPKSSPTIVSTAKNQQKKLSTRLSNQRKTERHLFFTLLNHPNLIQKYQNQIILKNFEDPWIKKGWNLLLECLYVDVTKKSLEKIEERVGKQIMETFLTYLNPEEKKATHAVLLDSKYQIEPEKQIQDCIKKLRRLQLQKPKINIKKEFAELHKESNSERKEQTDQEQETILLEELQYIINEEKKFQ